MRIAPIIVALLVAGCEGPAPSWHVEGNALRAPDGRAVILRGANVSGAQKASPYLDDMSPDDYAQLRSDWGMNAIRFVTTWAAIEPSEGSYDDAYLDRVAERMEWARAAGLVVVIDMHEDVYGEGFGFDGAPKWTCDPSRYAAFVPQSPWFVDTFDVNVEACVDDFYTRDELRQHFLGAWRKIAERLAASPAVIGFDALNEPPWGTYSITDFEHDRLEPFYRDVTEVVRAAAPQWVAFLEPGATRNAGLPTSLTAFDFPNVMYAPHSYDAAAEGGDGFDATHRQTILDNVAQLGSEAQALQAGLWIGEYGGVASAPGITDYMTAQYDAAGAVAASTMYWAYDRSDGYGMLAPDGTEKPALLDVLVRPYPSRVAGDPSAYAFDAASATFTMLYTPDRSSAGPTEIVVPARPYPNGWHVDCGGCTFHPDGDELIIDTPPTATPASIVIRP